MWFRGAIPALVWTAAPGPCFYRLRLGLTVDGGVGWQPDPDWPLFAPGIVACQPETPAGVQSPSKVSP